MKTTVYIETTIPSYYFDQRLEIANDIARTRQWWDEEREWYEVFTSPATFEELGKPGNPYASQGMELICNVEVLQITPEIVEIAEIYQAKKVMPGDPSADALHLAICAYYKIKYLLTWNCRHLANPNKVGHLFNINQKLGLFTPQLVTPASLSPAEE